MGKAQIQSEVLKYILITIVAFLIIAFSIVIVKNLGEKRREAELISFIDDIKGSVEIIATRVGSVDRETFPVPQDIELVCLLDLEKKDEILQMPLVDKHLFIKDSLETGATDNVFLITNDELEWAFHEENICFETYPYYQCVKTSYDRIDMFLQGVGDCTTIFVNTTALISQNIRGTSKYEKITTGGFLAKDGEEHQNYRDLLQIIPLAFVNSRDEYSPYPYVVYYKNGDISNEEIEDVMIEKGIDSVLIFRGLYNEEGYEYNGRWIYDDKLDNYFSYWDIIYDATIIGYNNKDGALITALFAAFTNTPLIFIDEDNLAGYEEFLKGKNVNVVDENLIDPEVINFIENPVNDINAKYFSSADLRILTSNRILELKVEIIIP